MLINIKTSQKVLFIVKYVYSSPIKILHKCTCIHILLYQMLNILIHVHVFFFFYNFPFTIYIYLKDHTFIQNIKSYFNNSLTLQKPFKYDGQISSAAQHEKYMWTLPYFFEKEQLRKVEGVLIQPLHDQRNCHPYGSNRHQDPKNKIILIKTLKSC